MSTFRGLLSRQSPLDRAERAENRDCEAARHRGRLREGSE